MASRIQPWHYFVHLKDELKSGELTLAEFAADLHEVTLARGKRLVYEDPAQFFALTFPTLALRDLVKDVATRLAGRSDRAVRQLELTYGGGKTHTLIALYHLFRDPAALPTVPAVREFREHVGADLPPARIATLCFDKIDVEKGIEDVRAPNGQTRTLRHPWSVFAYQLAGDEGLSTIHADGLAEERDTPPAEPLLTKLLEAPQQHGLAALVLIDEVLMYAREKAGLGGVWRERIVDFFQYLTQAVAKVDCAAIVASLLATDPAKQQGDLGGRLVEELSGVFRRQSEQGVQPVQKEDVAEVLRRRFFAPDGLGDESAYRSHIIGVVRSLAKVDEATAKERAAAEQRFLASFPFHPDLTEVFYSRWTQLDGFQRTRGILRTLAIALREAEAWDRSPLIGPAALLAAPGETNISDAVTELARIADAEDTGRSSNWARLLEAELEKARQVQTEHPALIPCREAEQAVVAVFLHSQPIGGKANTPELLRLAGSASPDPIELEKGLSQWRDISWFLDDEDAGLGEGQDLPKSWRLGNRPNLRQMHDEACKQRVSAEDVDSYLLDAIRKTRSALDGGASATGAKLHMLPESPRDVGDDLDFHFVILGPDAVSDSGKPSRVAKRFIDEASGPNRPRVHRNALVLAVPSRDGLEMMRSGVRSLLGWEDVERQLRRQEVDPLRAERLRRNLQDARQRLPDAIRQAYGVVVTVSEGNDVQAFKLRASAGPLFPEVKNDERSRIKETAIDAETLLPDGPYHVWREDEDARRVADLAVAFARDPRLPKLLHPRILRDTVLQGVQRGLFVARLARPDGTARTWWHEPVDSEAAKDPLLEVVLPQCAELAELPENLLAPDALPALWSEGALPVRKLLDYFSGEHIVAIDRGGYEDHQPIPRCAEDAIRRATTAAVNNGTVWVVNGPASYWKEEVGFGAFDEAAELRPPPTAIPPHELTAEHLPGAWQDGTANGADLVQAISHARGVPVPWGLVYESIQAAAANRWLDLAGTGDSGVRDGLPHYGEARSVQVRLPRVQRGQPQPPTPATVELDAAQVQDLAELVPQLLNAAAGHGLRIHVRISLDDDAPESIRTQIDALLSRVAPELRQT